MQMKMIGRNSINTINTLVKYSQDKGPVSH